MERRSKSSIYQYDTSIVNKFRSLFDDSRITIMPPDVLFRFVANLKQDEVKFPLIALTRLGYVLNSLSRGPASYQGVGILDADGKRKELQFIPATINYQLDVITQDRSDNDECVEELLFYLINHPTLEVNILKGANITHVFSMFLNADIVDNSDIESHMSRGEYFRSTMTFSVPDARLWKTTNKSIKRINEVTLIGTPEIPDRDNAYYEEKINISSEEIK